MILTTEVILKTSNKNITYFKSLGYNINSGDVIKISPTQLNNGSHEKILVCCDKCGCNKIIEYKTYFLLTKGLKEDYYCNKCKNIKIEKTNLEKYGVKSVFQIKDVKDIIKKKRKKNKKIHLSLEELRLKNKNNFYNSALKIHNNNFEYISPYINMNTQIEIKCKKCNTIFKQKPKEHIHGKQGCPNCKKSKGEITIEKYLKEYNLNYIKQKIFDNCVYKKPLKFDFYLLDYNTCIEFDGEQHFKSVKHWGGGERYEIIKKRDEIKNNYCKNNNIKLLRISYKDDIEIILNKWIQKNIK